MTAESAEEERSSGILAERRAKLERLREALLELRDAVLEHHLLVLRVVVLGVLGDVPELAGRADAIRDLAAFLVREILDLLLQLLVAFGSEDDVLQRAS